MADWNPALYSRFEAQRTRPARDLLEHVGTEPRTILDVGCGPGNSTELLVARFPDAKVIGIDTSEAMIATAIQRVPTATFVLADAATYDANDVDLVYSNATLQWVKDHERLIPRLVAMLAPGGVLAVQVPDNLAEPMHAMLGPLCAQFGIAPDLRAGRLLSPERYYDLLSPHGEADVWTTIYRHPMPDPHAIVEWVRATGLRPVLDALPAVRHAEFLAAYEAQIAAAYPPRADGSRLLAYPRLFFTLARTSARAG
ncbi:MAG TPA: trans-aconitate 2-methyltransferase [Kofleriaceae bacterium]